MRFSLERPDIFRTQLRALYRASSHAPMRLMLPMVSGVTELERALAISDDVASALRRKGNVGVGQGTSVPLGIMIETPSAALTADHLGRRCAFLSLGPTISFSTPLRPIATTTTWPTSTNRCIPPCCAF